jgi:hypothetical protein
LHCGSSIDGLVEEEEIVVACAIDIVEYKLHVYVF